MSNIKELLEYRKFTAPAELHKAVNTLRGIVAGITTDTIISKDEINELANWCILHEHLERKHPFNELLPVIRKAYKDGIIDTEESSDILWLCNNFISANDYYDLETSSLQFLFGLLQGIMADNELSDDEIKRLNKWLITNDFLDGTYPFDEIHSLVSSILLDGIVTPEERERLMAFIGEFIDTTMSYNISEKQLYELKNKYSINGICAQCQSLEFKDNVFCFTGASDRASRKEIAELILQHGGIYKDAVLQTTAFLIVGNKGNPCWAYSCYGRKIEQAENMRKAGNKIRIINEIDFWDILDDM